MADHALEGGAAGLQVGARQIERRHRGGAARLRLRHVGARHLADVEAVLGGPQIARQHRDVVLAQAHDGLVAHHVHVGRHRLQQHAAARRCAASRARRARSPRPRHRVDDAEAAEQRLHQAHLVAARIAVAVAQRRRPGGGLLVGGVGRAGDHGAVARQRARHLLVGGPQRRPRRVQPRVGPVGRRKRLSQRLRLRRAARARNATVQTI